VNQRMSRSSTLDLSKAHEVATLEIAISVLEFPQRRFGGPSVEDVANFGIVSAAISKKWTWCNRPLWNPYMFNCRTNEEIFVCLKYCLRKCELRFWRRDRSTHERTLEKSLEGDMTKLSAEGDHDIKCCIL
jgi:hypothetical protein